MPKITVIGAGSASLGENTLAAIMRSKKLHGSTLSLVDRNSESLDIVQQLANRLNQKWKVDFTVEAHSHHLAANLPRGATAEKPMTVDGEGIHPVQVGEPPDAVAELCRRELLVGQLCVDAVMEGSREKALQCLLLDPMISDISTAKSVLDDYLISYKEHLPQFWKKA